MIVTIHDVASPVAPGARIVKQGARDRRTVKLPNPASANLRPSAGPRPSDTGRGRGDASAVGQGAGSRDTPEHRSGGLMASGGVHVGGCEPASREALYSGTIRMRIDRQRVTPPNTYETRAEPTRASRVPCAISDEAPAPAPRRTRAVAGPVR